jgi:hypothetical protein
MTCNSLTPSYCKSLTGKVTENAESDNGLVQSQEEKRIIDPPFRNCLYMAQNMMTNFLNNFHSFP